jgi:CheY-like chemotaxis protein
VTKPPPGASHHDTNGGRPAPLLTARLDVDPVPIDVNATVETTAPMLRMLLGDAQQLALRLSPGLPAVAMKPEQLQQVLVSLVLAVRERLALNGTLALTTSPVALDAAGARRIGTLRDGGFACLEATAATGRGVSVARTVAERDDAIVGPASAHVAALERITGRAGGAVRVAGRADGSVTMEVYLPALVARAHEGAAVSSSDPLHGTETVLVVENEQSVRDVIADVLAMHGYRVLEAADGDEAIRISEAHPGPIHLLVVDVVMPGTSGEALVNRVATVRPDIRTLYISGYTDELVRQHGIIPAGRSFLQKPFTVEGLARKVREALAATG